MRSVIFSYAQKSAQDFSKIFDGKKVFDNPKSHLDMERLVTYLTNKDDLAMDFFAGSGSFAHGVLEANRKDGGNRKYILVQLPEPTPEGSPARDMGLRTIAEICIERLKRIGNNYRDLHSDVGFRTFALTRSNFKVWSGDIADGLEDQIEMHVDHLSADSGPEDTLYELLLKAGFSLSTKVQSLPMGGTKVFSVEDGALLICLEKEITTELIDALAEANPLQVICLDEGFKGNDQLKTNAVQTFRARAEAEESEIVFRTV
jgi:adenine-specific DNA-methyltransferase